MTNVKVVSGLHRLRDPELDTKAQTVIMKMTGNANFPDPLPALADVQAGHEEFQKALALAKDGGKVNTAVKNEKRDALRKLLFDLSVYVQLHCKGSEAVALSSGFAVAKRSENVGILEKPANLRVDDGYNLGSVLVSVTKVPNANSYLFEYTPAPVTEASIWFSKPGSSKKLLIEGLKSGATYSFRVAAVGSHDVIVFSDVITRMVL